MNILVCIKQVPDTTEIKIDPIKKTLIRAGVPSIVNPYDAYALELALMMKDENPNINIVLLSMGPEQAKEALYECIAMGADRAYLVSGRSFGGSDTLATSYILSQAIKKVEESEGDFDLILCGKQAIDGDTAQVGPEIAEHLGLPQVTNALELQNNESTIHVKKKTDNGIQVVSLPLPGLVTVTKTAHEPRYASRRAKANAMKTEIAILGESDFTTDSTKIGLNGSPTRVNKTFVAEKNKETILYQEQPSEVMVTALFEKLLIDKVI